MVYVKPITSQQMTQSHLAAAVWKVPELSGELFIVHVLEQRYTRVYNHGSQILSTPTIYITCDENWGHGR